MVPPLTIFDSPFPFLFYMESLSEMFTVFKMAGPER